jgi:hypothetical protein
MTVDTLTEFRRKGGIARAAALSKKRRLEISRKANEAKKAKAKKRGK